VSVDSSTEPARLIIVGECDVELWGLGAADRHRRAFARVGVLDATDEAGAGTGRVIAVRADYLLSQELVGAIAARPGVVMTAGKGEAAVAAHTAARDLGSVLALLRDDTVELAAAVPEGMVFVEPAELGAAYDIALRKRSIPLVLPYASTPLEVLEEKTFGAAYKGATDFVTKWCWPRPARWATRWAAARGISPNSVTTASLVLVVLAMWLFAEGNFLAAIPVAWAMTR